MKKIERRQSLKMLGAGPLLEGAAQSESKKALPNLVVYMSDDHGLLFSEPYGGDIIRTPNLAKFASEGMRFTHVFNTSPSCAPSRTSMLTGLWPARHGVEPNHKPPKPGVTGLPSMMKSLGYETACFGKVAHNDFAKYYNFDVVRGPNIGATDANEVEQYLAARDKSKPLCLFSARIIRTCRG